MDAIFDLLVDQLDIEKEFIKPKKKDVHPDRFRPYLFNYPYVDIEKPMQKIDPEYWEMPEDEIINLFKKIIKKNLLYGNQDVLIAPHLKNGKIPSKIKKCYIEIYNIADIIICRSLDKNFHTTCGQNSECIQIFPSMEPLCTNPFIITNAISFLLNLNKPVVCRIIFYLSFYLIILQPKICLKFKQVYFNKIKQFQQENAIEKYCLFEELKDYLEIAETT